MVSGSVWLVCCSNPVSCCTAHERLHGLPRVQAQGRLPFMCIQYHIAHVHLSSFPLSAVTGPGDNMQGRLVSQWLTVALSGGGGACGLGWAT